MATHLYEIGDEVSLNFHEGQFFSKLNPFTIEAQMPHLGSSLQYRIKSKSEACRRVVAEYQLSSFGDQPDTMPIVLMGSPIERDHAATNNPVGEHPAARRS